MSSPEPPDEALSFNFVRSRGPGGQNVNKVATAVQLFVDTQKLGEPEYVRRRLLELAGSRARADGVIVLFVDTTRSQARNRQIAIARLTELLQQARRRPKRRIATRPSAKQRAKRLDSKRRRSTLKSNRQKPQTLD